MLQIAMVSVVIGAAKPQGKRYAWGHALVVVENATASHQAHLGTVICVLAMPLSQHMEENSNAHKYI